jgi:DNA polymerase III alpha subunit
MDVLPIFRTQYSIGKGILTLKAAGKSDSTGPDSVVDIAKARNMEDVFVIDDSMSGYLEGYKNFSDAGIQFNFGVRMMVCDDIDKKSDEARESEHRVIVMCDNSIESYQALIKIYSLANSPRAKYYYPRIDFKHLKEMWHEDLKMVIPFYDSFLFKNSFFLTPCVPDFSFCKPTFFIEDNDTLFDDKLKGIVENYCEQTGYDTLQTKTIYYKDRKDLRAYVTFRCACGMKRGTLEKPNLDHMCSEEFSVESYDEQAKR